MYLLNLENKNRYLQNHLEQMYISKDQKKLFKYKSRSTNKVLSVTVTCNVLLLKLLIDELGHGGQLDVRCSFINSSCTKKQLQLETTIGIILCNPTNLCFNLSRGTQGVCVTIISNREKFLWSLITDAAISPPSSAPITKQICMTFLQLLCS